LYYSVSGSNLSHQKANPLLPYKPIEIKHPSKKVSKLSFPEVCLTTVKKDKQNKYFQPYFENNWFSFYWKVLLVHYGKTQHVKLTVVE